MMSDPQQQQQQPSPATVLVTQASPGQTSPSTTVPLARRVLTKYERAKVIGMRAEQLSRGAQCFVDVDPSGFDAYELAERELAARVIPFVVVRHMPSGGTEFLRIEDVVDVHARGARL